MTDTVYTDVVFAAQRRARAKLMAELGLLAIIAATLAYVPSSLRGAYFLMATEQISVAAISLAIYIVSRSSREFRHQIGYVSVAVAFFHIWAILVIGEGVDPSARYSSSHWWFIPITAISFSVLGTSPLSLRIAPSLAAFASFCFVETAPVTIVAIEPQSFEFIASLESLTHISAIAVTLVLVGFLVYELGEAELYLESSNASLARLVGNMLPAPVAKRLREQGTTFADGHSSCSVLFADIVGFTPLSVELSADRLVSLLDEIFSRFDALTESHGLEKIKTIGDAYMAAAGVPTETPRHAELCVSLAIGMRAIIQEYSQLQIRIGINSGSVVAGIIGRKRYIYDLWGDTVNIASRLESHGLANEIQVSETTAGLIRSKYDLKSRGKIDLKGRGKMKVYLVLGRRLDSSRAPHTPHRNHATFEPSAD